MSFFVKSICSNTSYNISVPVEKTQRNETEILKYLKEFIKENEEIPVEMQVWKSQDLLSTEEFIKNHQYDEIPSSLSVTVPCLGGKGGFGSMLRAEGKKNLGKKTTNFESSRDLNGRRVRQTTDAQKLADYIAKAPERKKKEKDALEEKLKKTEKKLNVKESVAPVDNSAFLKEKEKVLETMDNAIDIALKNASSSSFKVAKPAMVGKKSAVKKTSAWRKHDSESD